MSKRVLLSCGLVCAGMVVGAALVWLGGRAREILRPDGDEVLIVFTATIDGSDRFIFTRDNAWNEHGQWSPPAKVTFNGVPWDDLAQTPPQWPKIAASLELSAARIVTRQGRDVIAMEPNQDGFELVFADTPMGAARYEVTVAIPKK